MNFLLDTNACIDHLRRGPGSRVSVKLLSAPAGNICLCSIVVGELLFGARRSNRPTTTLMAVRAFCAKYVSLPFDDSCADDYSSVRAHLSNLGLPIGPNDLLIAAIAIANGLTLVSHNTAEFGRVPGLMLDDWQI